MRKHVLLCLVTAFAAAAAFGQQVGEIVFVDGRVEILRNEQTLTEADLAIGASIENLDRVRTGDDGQVTIALNAGGAAPAEIRVTPKTTFYVEIEQVERRSTTTLGLMSGSIALNVQKLSASRSMAVRTETTTMGVRGTTFDVTSSPGGDVLVSTQEGSVVCSDADKNDELAAEPGQVVERRVDDDTFRAIPVAVSSVEKFRRDWIGERMEVFRNNALRVTRAYAVRYDRLIGEFNDAYTDLMRNRELLSRWAREDREGKMGGRTEVMRDKRAVVSSLFRLRRTGFIFERVYFRLAELQGYYNQGFGQGDLRAGLSAAQFWRRFESDQKDLAAKMARVRAAIGMYARRNDGEFPGES